MSYTTRLVDKLKDNEEDFEWYPTSDEIINAIHNYVVNNESINAKKHWRDRSVSIKPSDIKSILDIGAGDGRVLKALEDIFVKSSKQTLYAIEKSPILQGLLPNNVFVIGSDFYEQSLMDKDIDFTYSNPPYKDFEQWMVKILSESDGYICMTVPSRWTQKQSIMNVISNREISYDVFYQTSFLNADRTARCKVDVIMFQTSRSCGAFANWFDKEFKFKTCNIENDLDELEKEIREKVRTDLISKKGLVEALVDFYNDEISKLQNTYLSLFEIDPTLLKEIGVNKKDLLANLKLKIKSIKKKYWGELLNGLDEITSRLTKKSRDIVIDTLNCNTSVDFCTANVRSIVLWCIRNANTHIDEQVVSLFETLMTEKAVKRYKSTRSTFVDGNWKYNKCDISKNEPIYLEYRFVSENMSYYKKDLWKRPEHPTVFTDTTIEHIRSICIVAYNLGFPQTDECTKLEDLELDFGKPFILEYKDFKTGKIKPLVRFKLHQNNNIHFNFAPEFMAKLNVEFGRLKGWVSERKEAYECMKTMFNDFGINEFEALTMFSSNKVLSIENSSLLRLEAK